MRMLLYGVPLFLQQDIWPGITSKFGRGKEEDDSAEAFFKALETELRTQRDKYREKTDLLIRSLTGDGLLDEEDAGDKIQELNFDLKAKYFDKKFGI